MALAALVVAKEEDVAAAVVAAAVVAAAVVAVAALAVLVVAAGKALAAVLVV